ncbi:hypothetical protein FHR70_001655 [Microvirga lupini]|uniref:Uncharacterized protein n=1 Tax=Microvirga lupini TaxID=420324 RepID=A0A7W4VKQ3_9HYPH|nr:hypothetical protein [Microvirga lupini]MBB3018601.1 hypothetical protein [Microvirga lupini]
MKIIVALNNHQSLGNAYPTARHNTKIIFRFADGSITHSFHVADLCKPGTHAVANFEFPNRFDVSGCIFAWFEGNPAVGRSVYLERPKEYIGKPWNGAIITWADSSLYGFTYEYHYGGIGNVSNVGVSSAFSELMQETSHLAFVGT